MHCSPWGHKESDRTEQLNWTYIQISNNSQSITSVVSHWYGTNTMPCYHKLSKGFLKYGWTQRIRFRWNAVNNFNIWVSIYDGEDDGTPLQYSCLENPMDGGACWAAVHGVAKSRTWLSDFTFTFHFHALEKEMAPHSSVLAWKIPGMGEPGGLPSMGSHRAGHDWSYLAAAAAAAVSIYEILLCDFKISIRIYL